MGNAWIRESPALARVLALLGAITALLAMTSLYGWQLHSITAVVFGVVLGVSMRWPIIMPSTGVRVLLAAGLLMEALWRGGITTAVLMILVVYGVRLFVLFNVGDFWEWHRPVVSIVALFTAYGAALLVAGSAEALRGGTWFDAAAFVLVFVYWGTLTASWSLLKSTLIGRSRMADLILCLQQTWWAPLLFLVVAWVMDMTYRINLPLEIPASLFLVYIQSQVGPVFTTLHQDRAVALVARASPSQSAAQRATAQRVMQIADSLARSAHLSVMETRLIGYAALLQDQRPIPDPRIPLWLPDAPSPELRVLLEAHVREGIRRVEADGALLDVAPILRYRYASSDGQGYPEASGGAIPRGAQVLAAANAIHYISHREPDSLSAPEAIDWIRNHARQRFSPWILAAMISAFIRPPEAEVAEDDLPRTLLQLRGLVGGSDSTDTLWIGLWRLWLQLRRQVGFAQHLPPEVQAVAHMATVFASSTDVDQTAQITVDTIGQVMEAKTALALSAGADTLNMTFRATYGYRHLNMVGRMTAVHGGQMSRAIMNQHPIQVADVRELTSGLADELSRTEGIRSLLMVPLVGRGQTLGLLIVGTTSYHWFTPREIGLIHLMAGQAAVALENGRLIAEAEERLQHISNLKSFTDTLLENLTTSILVVDPEGRLMLSNAAARFRFGGSLTLEVGHPLPEEWATAFAVERALSGETGAEVDMPRDGDMLEVQSAPLLDRNGVLLGAICTARDVTAVRLMEQQVRRVEKLAAIGELAAGAAHEIRNPLTSIRGFMQLLHARAATADGEFFQIVLREIDRIDDIIRDMLLLARPAEPQRVLVSLPDLLDEVLFFQRPQLTQQGVEVIHHWEAGVGQAWIDSKLFRQMVLNLLRNAGEAMPHGGKLHVRLCRVNTEKIALEVTDSGVGISRENLDRLFIPFFTTKEEGTGLGLALCHNIVQAHHGRIDVESKLGVGSTFRITLPAH